MLQEHIPYRLTHLNGLVWASENLLGGYRPQSVIIQFDGRDVVSCSSFYLITNPLFEVGILYCRVLLEFLGIQHVKTGTKLVAIIKRRYPDDFGIEHFGLSLVTIPQLLSAPFGDPENIKRAIIATLVSADKGVAHFTTGDTSRAYAANSLLCAKVVIWSVEKYVYQALKKSTPRYRRWTPA